MRRPDSRMLLGGLAALLLALSACSEQGATSVEAPLSLDAAAMEAEVKAMIATPDILDRHRQAVRLMDSLNEENLPGAIAGYEASLNRVDPHEVRLFANAWAKLDPKGALDRILDEWRFPRISHQAVLEVVYEWALSGDSEALRAYVDPSFDGPIEARDSVTKIVVLAVLQALGTAGDWDQLTDLLAAREDDGDRELWITEVFVAINRAHGLEGSKAWMDSIAWDAPNDLKISVMKRLLHSVAAQPGNQAQTWYEEIESHPRAIEVLPMAVKGWGLRQPPEALLWLAERAPSQTRDRVMREISLGWVQRDAGAAEEWLLANFSNEPIRRAGLVPVIQLRMQEKRFEEAADLARAEGLEDSKEKLLAQVFREWATLSPEAVDAYAAKHDVSRDVVALYHELVAKRTEKVKRRRVLPDVDEEGELQ